MNWMQRYKQRVEQENPQPERQGESLDPQTLRFMDDFLETCVGVSEGVETLADTLYANYQASCESRHVAWVNPTAFSVRVMNFYRGRGVQRDEVVTNGGKLVAIYRGLASKLAQPIDNRSDLFLPDLPTEPPQAETEAVSERRRTEPVPIKDLSRDELIACIRELESELGESSAVIDEYWGMVDLQVWLKGLEQLKNTGRRVPVPMTPLELDYYRVKP